MKIPFKNLTHCVIINLVNFSVILINAFDQKGVMYKSIMT